MIGSVGEFLAFQVAAKARGYLVTGAKKGGKLILKVVGLEGKTVTSAEFKGFVKEWNAANCFPPDTLVDTESGLRAIASVERGDRVWAYDFESGAWRLSEVEFRHDSNYDGLLVTIELDGGKTTATAHHPFWVIEGEDLENRPAVRHVPADEDRGHALPGRWVNSHEVLENDIVFVRSGGPARVLRITHRREQTSICNLTIRLLHTFCVGEARVLVHNTSGGSGAAPHFGPRWRPRDVADPAFEFGCEGVAVKIQKYVGGEIRRITPGQGGFLGEFMGRGNRWAYRDVVVRGGRVYDAFTGYKGLPIEEYKALWKYRDGINFGF